MAFHSFGAVAGCVVGATAGALVAGVPGLIVGAAVGAVVGTGLDSATGRAEEHDLLVAERPQTVEEIDAEIRRLFARHLARLFCAVASVDDGIRQEESEAILAFFVDRMGFEGEELAEVRRVLEAHVQRPPTVDEAVAGVEQAIEPAERLLLLQALYEVCLADNPMSATERAALERVATRLGISAEDHRGVRALFFAETDRAYELLGLAAGAEPQTIRRRYRELAAQYHPDKVARLGPEAVAIAQAKFVEINQAYEQIRRDLGF